ncbi:wax ester synthase/diacylglycerol acyltransferase 4-like [Macadamia integrifolia]|uniref:wax ester synthase/diacylglycerol acyltransferase 4-like n=1 Tax=Macadamia integrifolia TaxID=60698 RepID=UPI001C4E322D|nr:wax ester synthase/diacylglycerol acyltransferase 4-like [Macadamia integrifolia]
MDHEDLSRSLPPLSPLSQYINSSTLSVPIIMVIELDSPIEKSKMIEFLRDVFVPINDRFSSIIVTDKKGVQRWKKVEITIEDHIFFPTFPSSGQTLEDYDALLDTYVSKVAMETTSEGGRRPPWEVHAFTYPTSNAKGTIVFKLSHAIGDGYSLMSALFNIYKRADDPSLPVTMPSVVPRPIGGGGSSRWSRIRSFVSMCVNTVTDSALSLLQATLLEDDKTVIRSGKVGVEFEPISISSVTFTLDQIRQVQDKVGGTTVNEVMTGVISYAIQLYIQRTGKVSNGATRMTALVVVNARMLRGFKTIADMLKAHIWGNHFSLLHVALPSTSSDQDLNNVDPLEFIIKAKDELRRKRNSMALYFTSRIWNIISSLKGPEVAAGYVHAIFKNTSISISSLIGPSQKIVIADHPINSFYYTVAGIPQSLIFTIVSYMGKLKVVVRTEREFIDAQVFVSCLKDALEKISDAADDHGKDGKVEFH